MDRFKRPKVGTIFVAVLAILALGSGTATAAKFVTSKDIKNGTIKLADLSSGTKTALKGQRGPAGQPGPQGPQGPAGATSATRIVATQGDGTGTAMAVCPAGMRPVSGGGVEGGSGYLWANGAAKDDSGHVGWLVAGDAASPVTAFAYCSGAVASFTFPDGTVSAAAAKGLLNLSEIKSIAKARAAK
jgi:hypothetical protein